MKRSRTVLGLLLIVFAVAGLIFWEVKGRETLLLDTVIVASEKIPAGTVISRDLLKGAGVLEESRIQGSLKWDMLHVAIGQVALRDIVENSQLSEEYLADNDFYLRSNESIFVLHPEWIAMRSSAIRRGDWIDIYENSGYYKIGTYRVAFVKDANEIEVTDGEGHKESDSLNRTVSSSLISHVEIIANTKEYERIARSAQNGEAGLLLVQRQVMKK